MKHHILFGLKCGAIMVLAGAAINLFIVFHFLSTRNWIGIINANAYGEGLLEYYLIIFGAICAVPVMFDYIIQSFKRLPR